MFGFFKNRRRQKLLAQPLPTTWREIIAGNVAIYVRLAPAERVRAEAALRVIASERRFVGCQGLLVTDEMKVTIAAQAALLLLGEEGYYFDRITTFLLYPDKLVLPPAGLRPSAENEGFDERIALGVAYQQGELTLSWPDVLQGGRTADDGENVTLHELAHHLDGLDGAMGGSPPGLSAEQQDRFQRSINRELIQLRRDLADGLPTVLLPDAAENAAELFAYGTEAFFERPHDLQKQYPRLFSGLRDFYKIDPRHWFPEALASSQVSVDEWDDDPATPAELPRLDTADAYFTRGHEYFEIGRYDLAEADFNQVVRLSPDDQEAVVYRAESRFWAGEVEAALADAERACRLDPRDKAALRVRGLCCIALEQDREGLADLAGALDTPSDDADGLYFRALAYARLDEPQQAMPSLDRVIELDPEDPEAYDLRAECWEQLGNMAAAASDRARANELRAEGEE